MPLYFDTANLLKAGPQHGLTNDELNSQNDNLSDYLKKIESRNQGFYTTIDDKKLQQEISDFAASVKGKYEYIVVLGIGGSALGISCIRECVDRIYGKRHGIPELMVLDNIDPFLLAEAAETINPAKTLFVVITKSGTTPETLAQYFYFRDIVSHRKLPLNEHFVFITNAKKGFLRKIADQEKIRTFPVPENVGGRFSVLTAVGLLPASLIDVDIDEMIAGAKSMRDNFLQKDASKNLPFKIATIQYLLYRKGKNINVMFPYAQKLVRFADWYRQLLAESIGKTPEIGITPVSALGVTDQHSQLQLYNEGPNDKLFMFLWPKNEFWELPIPSPASDDESVKYLEGVTFQELFFTEMEGTRQALTKNNRPNITISMDKIDEQTIGQLFMLFEGATAFLGEMFGINTYDQPGVELSKKITKELLMQKNA